MDTRGTIFVLPTSGDKPLEEFARQMFTWLGISSYKEECAGKDDHPVFVGSAVGITVWIEDPGFKHWREPYKTKLEKYPFVITLGPQGTSMAADYLVQHAHTLAWRLSHEGFRCFVPKDQVTARSEQDGMIYEA